MRRGRLEILGDILSATKKPSTKTRIVYHANLSFSQAERYLKLLIKEDLIECDEEGKNDKYEITEKGRKFLNGFQELENLMDDGKFSK